MSEVDSPDWAAKYSHKVEAFSATSLWKDDLENLLASLPRGLESILDLGCGTGRLLADLRLLYPDAALYGVDINTVSLAKAQERCPSAILQTGLAEIPDRSIDCAIVMHALPQIQDLSTTLLHLWDTLTPGGHLFVVTHNLQYTRLRYLSNKMRGYKGDPSIRTRFTQGSLVQLMRDFGFVPQDYYRYGGNLSRLIPFCRPRLFFYGRKPA